MVFESLLISRKYHHPYFVFIVGVLYASVAIILSSFFPEGDASYYLVFFTALMSFHFMYTMICHEEGYDLRLQTESKILRKHAHLIMLFIMLYLGFFVSFTMWNLVLSEDAANQLFSQQKNSITIVNQKIISSQALTGSDLFPIFFHNTQVLIFSILFSFLFGAGAIFILSWNASVGGAYIGEFIKTQMLHLSPPAAILLGLLRYLPHGLLEFSAYFAGALAGGIISVALIKHDFMSDKFYRILYDTSELLCLAVLLLLSAAFVEVFVTPFLVERSAVLFLSVEQLLF